MDVKTLARELPLYGQQAVRSALNALTTAGHLRRRRERVGEERTRWVHRTYFSRTARDETWWAAFLAGRTPTLREHGAPGGDHAPETPDVPEGRAAQAPAADEGAPPEAGPDDPAPAARRRPRPPSRPAPAVPPPRRRAPQPAGPPPSPYRAPRTPYHRLRAAPPPGGPRPPRSEAYELLVGLGRTDPRLTLSAAECAELEPLAAEWLARGATGAQLTHALTAGLPQQVHHPGALAHRRLIMKIPDTFRAAAPSEPRWAEIVCLFCDRPARPGHPEDLISGVCRACKREIEEADRAAADSPPPPTPSGLTPEEIHAHAARARAAIRRRPEGETT